MVMPERIAQVEIATLYLDTGAFFKALSPSAGPSNAQSTTSMSFMPYRALLLIQCLLLNPFHNVPLPSCTTSVAKLG